MTTEGTPTCGNVDCRLSETGRCVEGLEPIACPNYGKPLERVVVGTSAAPKDLKSLGIPLPSAGRLSVVEAKSLLRKNRGYVIAIIGPHDCGKTSFIAGIFEKFQSGPIGEYFFRNSSTLHGFEEACHDSRLASERGTAHSERTKRGQIEFFQIEIAAKSRGETLNLILGDRAGEEYRDATDNVDIARGFLEVERSDCLALLVDGGRLIDPVTRHEVASDVLLIVQGLVDAGMTSKTQRVSLILTKLDAIASSAVQGRVSNDYDNLLSRLIQRYGGNFLEI